MHRAVDYRAMESVVIVVLAVVAIGALIALAVTMRRTPTIGQGELPGSARVGDLGLPAGEKRRVITKHTVVSRRVVVAGHPGSQTVTIDGKTYGSLDEIPDAATRDVVRSALSMAETEVKDPKLQELLHEELEGLGVEPPADPSRPTLSAGDADADADAGAPPGSPTRPPA